MSRTNFSLYKTCALAYMTWVFGSLQGGAFDGPGDEASEYGGTVQVGGANSP